MLNSILNININSISNVAVLLFVFYMLVSTNFLADLIGCQMKQILHSSMLAKHILGFILLFFLVTLGNKTDIDEHIIRNLILTTLVYTWFIVTTHSPFIISLIIIILLIILYILNKRKERLLNENISANLIEAKKIEKIQTKILILAVIFSFIGIIIYIIERKIEHGDEFTYLKFIIGPKECKAFSEDSKILSI